MDIYHVWCDLKPGLSDSVFAEKLGAFLNGLKADGCLESWRLTRCKLGLSPDGMPEFHIMIETKDLAQLDLAFKGSSFLNASKKEYFIYYIAGPVKYQELMCSTLQSFLLHRVSIILFRAVLAVVCALH